MKNDFALEAFLKSQISGCLNNITDWEKRQASAYLEDPGGLEVLAFTSEKLINNPILIIRFSEFIKEKGIEAVFMIDQILWGLYKDGKNTPISHERARDLVEKLMEKERGR